MRLKSLLLPHPVLGQGDDVAGISEIRDDINVTTLENVYMVEFVINHENGTINDLVKFNKATYCCEVTCPGTLYRELFISSTMNFSFNIERTAIKGRVEFQVYCATLEAIPLYNNPASHKDYWEFNFQLETGDLIAKFGSFSFNADIQYQKLKAASSFMQIIPNDSNKDYTEYVLDDSKIQIKLPKDVYDKFRQDNIGKRKEYSEIIHASFVQNALLIALYNFKEHLERKVVWAESIKYRLLNEPDLNNGSEILDPNQIPILVQKLLGNPNKRLIDRLEVFSESQEQQLEFDY